MKTGHARPAAGSSWLAFLHSNTAKRDYLGVFCNIYSIIHCGLYMIPQNVTTRRGLEATGCSVSLPAWWWICHSVTTTREARKMKNPSQSSVSFPRLWTNPFTSDLIFRSACNCRSRLKTVHRKLQTQRKYINQAKVSTLCVPSYRTFIRAEIIKGKCVVSTMHSHRLYSTFAQSGDRVVSNNW